VVAAIAAIVPAAGRAERFGGGKLMAPIAGMPLIDHTLTSLAGAGIEPVVMVVDGTRPLPPTGASDRYRVRRVVNPVSARGMWSSIQAGLAAVAAGTLVVLPGDMPWVRSSTIRMLADRAHGRSQAVVPVHDGRRGHPVLLPGALREALLAADVASNLKQVLIDLDVGFDEVEVADPGVLRDVDVPADLTAAIPRGGRG